jgi:hypothetical protein
MCAVNRQYAREMHEKFGYLATWLPNVKVRLGDVGVINEHIFEAKASLRQRGIAFDVRNNPSAADLEYTSSDAITVEFKAAGAVPNSGTGLI